MEYYFTPKEYISSDSLTIVDDEAKHLTKVLRKKQGEEIYVTDGEGKLYKTKIENSTKESINCRIIERLVNQNEPLKKIILYQSLLKSPDRFEFAIEKSVELGVYSIQPVVTENVINKTTSKTERWQSIALSAMKQSQRCILPKINEPISINDAMENDKSQLKFIAHEKSGDTISDLKNKTTGIESISIMIGPEGGFTVTEIELAVKYSFEVLNLGRRKYRSETAAIAAVTMLLYI